MRGIWDCFNTQPPEGGWMARIKAALDAFSFNTQPPEGGWFLKTATISAVLIVSTHSRPKAAGSLYFIGFSAIFVSTHSRPKAAGNFYSSFGDKVVVSTHSRPKAAGNLTICLFTANFGFNTQPPEGGWSGSRRV